MNPTTCPPLELVLLPDGRRAVPLRSLGYVLEWQLQARPDEASLELLLTAVHEAEEVPVPGVTPQRADSLRTPDALYREIHDLTAAKPKGLEHPGA